MEIRGEEGARVETSKSTLARLLFQGGVLVVLAVGMGLVVDTLLDYPGSWGGGLGHGAITLVSVLGALVGVRWGRWASKEPKPQSPRRLRIGFAYVLLLAAGCFGWLLARPRDPELRHVGLVLTGCAALLTAARIFRPTMREHHRARDLAENGGSPVEGDPAGV